MCPRSQDLFRYYPARKNLKPLFQAGLVVGIAVFGYGPGVPGPELFVEELLQVLCEFCGADHADTFGIVKAGAGFAQTKRIINGIKL